MTLSPDGLKNAIDLIQCVDISAPDDVIAAIAERMQLVNNSQKQNYQAAWADILARIENATASQLNGLNGALDAMTVPYTASGIISDIVAGNRFKVAPGNFKPAPGYMVVAKNGTYRQVPLDFNGLQFLERIMAHLTEKTDALIELGAGWGRNLGHIADRTKRRDLKYIACEQADSGREATERLLACDPTIDAEIRPFDFYAYDFNFMRAYDHPLIFSSAAIEQIAFLPVEFITDIFHAAPAATLLFYEPFGWQRRDNLLKFAVEKILVEISTSVPSAQSLFKTHSFDLRPSKFWENAAAWSVSGRYNLNLWSIIQHAERPGAAEIIETALDTYGSNPFNPYSIAVLQPTTHG